MELTEAGSTALPYYAQNIHEVSNTKRKIYNTSHKFTSKLHGKSKSTLGKKHVVY